MSLDHRARKRFEGFTETLAKAGIEIVDKEFYTGGSALVKGREMTQEILERNEEIDFLYYSNDLIGAGGLLYLLEKGNRCARTDRACGFQWREPSKRPAKRAGDLVEHMGQRGVKAHRASQLRHPPIACSAFLLSLPTGTHCKATAVRPIRSKRNIGRAQSASGSACQIDWALESEMEAFGFLGDL